MSLPHFPLLSLTPRALVEIGHLVALSLAQPSIDYYVNSSSQHVKPVWPFLPYLHLYAFIISVIRKICLRWLERYSLPLFMWAKKPNPLTVIENCRSWCSLGIPGSESLWPLLMLLVALLACSVVKLISPVVPVVPTVRVSVCDSMLLISEERKPARAHHGGPQVPLRSPHPLLSQPESGHAYIAGLLRS